MSTAGSVGLPPDSSGQKVDVVGLSTTAGTVVRQVVSLGDSTDATGLAIVENFTPVGNENALFVRHVGTASTAPTSTTQGDFFPSPGFNANVLSQGGTANTSLDSSGSLLTRGAVVTDEGSMSDEFSGASLVTALGSNCGFTNGSTTVTGAGFLTSVNKTMWVKANADGEAAWARVVRVVSDTQLLLSAPYAGSTNASAASSVTAWPTVTGAGGSIAVTTSLVNITSGTTSGSQTGIYRQVDYSPLIMEAHFALPTRQVNQEAKLGFQDSKPGSAIAHQAMVIFTGTNNTQVTFRTSWSAATADVKETVITLPGAAVTTANNVYRIEIGPTGCTLSINGSPSVTHKRGTPNPYTVMFACCYFNNTAVPAGSVVASLDRMTILNTDILQATSSFYNDPAPMKGAGVAGTPDTGVLTVQGITSGTPLNAQPVSSNGAALLPNALGLQDSSTNPTTTQFSGLDSLFNGATWDRYRNNINAVMNDTGAKTATFNGATQTNFNARGAKIMVLIGAVTGTTPTIQAQLQFSPDGGTTWLTYGPASASFTPVAGNTIVFDVYPTNASTSGATPAAVTIGGTQTVQLNAVLPRTWRLAYIIGGTTPSITLTNAYAAYTM